MRVHDERVLLIVFARVEVGGQKMLPFRRGQAYTW